AVQLILQAVSMAKGGEIFVLKMGTPVRIQDMARDLIRLSGLVPDKDIPIVFTGLKQGEKMEEELVEDPSAGDASDHPSIMIVRPDDKIPDDLEKRIMDLEILSRTAEQQRLVQELRRLVPTFAPAPAHSTGD
ncbi:MAG: polysaccharide biosynthesis protein, partial [Elusimicrobia bacterium]|nr:polysaccharide biosynthesis protein [Elusimicrobiota bacterium]